MRIIFTIAMIIVLGGVASADRIKDLTTIAGVRDNHLTGFGIVVGLDGSGDDIMSPIVKDALQKMLKRLGLTFDPTLLKAKNVAAVALTAELPAFGKPGMAFDVTAASLGNATSLVGGMLIAAPLKGPDGKTWAIAQGSLSVGGFVSAGATGSSAKKNHPTVGLLAGGAVVETAAPSIVPDKEIVLLLKQPDFTTAARMRDAIEGALGGGVAPTARDAGTVVVTIPAAARANVSALIAQVEAIDVDPDVRAKVVVDEKTGTIVIGEAVRLRPAAITFGALTIEINEAPTVSQPIAPLSKGKTKVVQHTDLKAEEQASELRVIGNAATVGDVAAALASLGAKPRDLVSILRALRAAGALRADLETL